MYINSMASSNDNRMERETKNRLNTKNENEFLVDGVEKEEGGVCVKHEERGSNQSIHCGQEQLFLNGFYMLLITSVVLNLAEKWGLPSEYAGKLYSDVGLETACETDDVCWKLVLNFFIDKKSIGSLVIFAIYCAMYNNDITVILIIISSFIIVGWEFPFLSNHSNLYVMMSLCIIMTYVAPNSVGAASTAKLTDYSQPKKQKARLVVMRSTLGRALGIVYFMAGFHKINSDFAKGCGTNFLRRFVWKVTFFLHESTKEWLSENVCSLPAVYLPINISVVLLELFSGVFLFHPPMAWIGVCGAAMLHAMVSLIGFVDFAAVALSVLYLILPIVEWKR